MTVRYAVMNVGAIHCVIIYHEDNKSKTNKRDFVSLFSGSKRSSYKTEHRTDFQENKVYLQIL